MFLEMPRVNMRLSTTLRHVLSRQYSLGCVVTRESVHPAHEPSYTNVKLVSVRPFRNSTLPRQRQPCGSLIIEKGIYSGSTIQILYVSLETAAVS